MQTGKTGDKLNLNHAVVCSCGSFRSYQICFFSTVQSGNRASHFGHLLLVSSYEALDFLAFGDVLSSGFMTPLTEPPVKEK